MNAKEFLALVENHPLPWKYEDAYAGRGEFIEVATDQPLYFGSAIDGCLRADLCAAAPAMAAAIIRWLLMVESVRANFRIQGDIPEVAALRASLPESLRP